MSKRLDIEFVRKEVYKIAGFTLLDDVYVNNNTKMTAIDADGYMYYFTLSNLRFSKSARMVDKSNPYSIDNIKLWLVKHGMPYELLSTEYKGNGSKNRKDQLLKLRCSNGHIFYRTWNDIQDDNIRCEDCFCRFVNHDQFVNYIEDKYNGEYVVIGDYINSHTKITIKHIKCGNAFETSPESLANGHGCPNPICCKKRGKDHYRYNENLTNYDRITNRDLSSEYKKWRLKIYQNYNFSCDICGSIKSSKNKIVAHHLNSWDENERDRYNVSNGVVMCQKCHVDFHKKYGFGKNNSIQYYEYKNNHGNTEVIRQIAQG